MKHASRISRNVILLAIAGSFIPHSGRASATKAGSTIPWTTLQAMLLPSDLPAADTNGQVLRHYVGELYGGGVVAAVWKENETETGLIVAPEDLSPNDCPCPVWSNISDSLIGPMAQHLSNGSANTAAIISQSGHSGSAASLCAEYERDGFSDWYLPSPYELGIIYQNLYLISLILEEDGDPSTEPIMMDDHWTSLEENESRAVRLSFRGMTGFNSAEKSTPYGRIRPVRRYRVE